MTRNPAWHSTGVNTTRLALALAAATSLVLGGCAAVPPVNATPHASPQVPAGSNPFAPGTELTAPSTAASPTQSATKATPTASTRTTATPDKTEEPAEPEVDCSEVKCIALTYDDGPSRYTNVLLDTFEEFDAKGTFFLIGSQVEMYPKTVRRMRDLGMTIGNHTYSHISLKNLSNADQAGEVARTQKIIARTTGQTPDYLRPPYGDMTKYALNQPLQVIIWDIDTLDWKTHDENQTIETVMEQAHPGAIVLMHDIQPSSVSATHELIPRLQAKGYHIVNIETLIATSKTRQVYRSKNG